MTRARSNFVILEENLTSYECKLQGNLLNLMTLPEGNLTDAAERFPSGMTKSLQGSAVVAIFRGIMQLANFSIDKGFTTLLYQGNAFDLHNDFDFTTVRHDEVTKSAEVIFIKGTGSWVTESDPSQLTLSFKNVSSIYERKADPDYPDDYLERDKGTIDMIGFSVDGDEMMDGVIDDPSGNELPALIFVFVVGRSVKIIAESVELSTT